MTLYTTKKLRQSGFGLVEIMVSLVIGMLVTLIITQVLTTFEGQKRSTSGTNDAQTNGGIAFYSLQREVMMTGYGLPLLDVSSPPLLCSNMTPAATDLSMVTIIDGGAGAGASDTLTLRYSNSQTGGMPIQGGVAIAAGPVATVSSTLSCQPLPATCPGNPTTCEDALVAMGTACTLTRVLGLQPAGPPQITLASATNLVAGASISCIGNWRQVQFRVLNNQLERVQVDAATDPATVFQPDARVTPVASDIVAIKAQYGISPAPSNNAVNQWVPATGMWAAANLRGSVANIANRNRIKAIRVALVARNSLREKDPNLAAGETFPTYPCSSLVVAAPTGLCSWGGSAASPAPAINIANDADGASWQLYRYRVFESIIPLRNMIWSRESL